jgi:hypothetical protein
MNTLFLIANTTINLKGVPIMNNNKDNISDKNVTHTDHRSKTKSNSLSNNATNDYKYISGADRPKSESTDNKRPSSGNV